MYAKVFDGKVLSGASCISLEVFVAQLKVSSTIIAVRVILFCAHLFVSVHLLRVLRMRSLYVTSSCRLRGVFRSLKFRAAAELPACGIPCLSVGTSVHWRESARVRETSGAAATTQRRSEVVDVALHFWSPYHSPLPMQPPPTHPHPGPSYREQRLSAELDGVQIYSMSKLIACMAAPWPAVAC